MHKPQKLQFGTVSYLRCAITKANTSKDTAAARTVLAEGRFVNSINVTLFFLQVVGAFAKLYQQNVTSNFNSILDGL